MKDSFTHVVAGNVPVLDSSRELVGILDVMSDITDSIDVLVSLDSKVLVGLDTSILFQLESGILEELSGRRDTRTHDDQIGRERILSLELDGTASARVGF